ncbi:EKC/KEOPS complex subunit TP53RK [Drosophila sulfurigaster albostrigata]|uniref:EKC/KEOPS complex subunit TP53RK n=1 Tax=Drosophila sulfurigaster albostrigata TaxID=89887 RepID=UPI002D21D9C0|nr:EKC/KEOPS complex subunit TP53RK [Drosophila sulfurigaster albostrigata]
MTADIIKQGAEGRLYLGDFKGESCLIKERFVKKYRHPELDTQITRQRMKAEVKASSRCLAAGILAPRILHSDLNTHKLYMEYFGNAQTAKKFIQNTVAAESDEEKVKEKLLGLCIRIGAIIGQMHANNIIHGDLTTSNILINPNPAAKNEYDVILIDFGLSHYNQGAEDKGVDLYVLERALLSTHSEQKYIFEYILAEYRRNCGKDEEVVIAKFDEVRARGRKRTMIG